MIRGCQNQEPPAGWPRYPRFNEPGDVPGPPVQFGPPVTNANVKAGHGFIPNGVEEKNLYYYHPDHLGSSSYITDREGNVVQHTEYIAFGEVLVDEHSTTNKMPYLFNGKELDFETGLYYYGARYYDPKTSIFLNVDPLVEKTMSPYAYVNNNPVNLIDPTGMEAEDVDDWIKRTGHSNWEYHSNIKSEEQAKANGFVAYANGRGDKNSSYTTTLSRSGYDIGVLQNVILGEGGNYTVNGQQFTAPDHYTDLSAVNDFGKAMTAFVAFPILLETTPFIISGGSIKTISTKATISILSQAGATGKIDWADFTADTFMYPIVGNIFGAAVDYDGKNLNVYGVTGNKTGNSVITDLMIGGASIKVSNGISNTFKNNKSDPTTKVVENMLEFTNQVIKGKVNQSLQTKK